VNNGGTIAPGTSVGHTSIIGDFTTNSGTIEIELNGYSNYDQINATGEIMVGGDLVVKMAQDFTPLPSDGFVIIQGSITSSVSGTFANLTPSGRVNVEGADGSFEVLFGSNSVLLANYLADAPVLVGDFNDDGVVDAADYIVWRKLEGTSAVLPNETASPGAVDIEDYDAWASNLGASNNGKGSEAAAPEPAALMLILIGCGSAGAVRNRRVATPSSRYRV
jgi:hypothetical protein